MTDSADPTEAPAIALDHEEETTSPEAPPANENEASRADPELIMVLDENTKLAANFGELGLSRAVLESVSAAGYETPTPIQSMMIPLAMTGRDIMGQARTGTGKTAAFLLPIFEAFPAESGTTKALILAPTRELAIQIHGEILRLGLKLGFTSITLYGGSSYEPQIAALSRGVDIIVGTPGRIMDHMRAHRLHLEGIRVAVLDEADRMLDLGFRKDIEYILKHCPKNRQTLLLSATIPDEIRKLARRFMHEPVEVWTAQESVSVDAIEQFYVVCERDEKFPVLLKLLEQEQPALGIVFCGTKMGAKRLAEKLNRVYIPAKEIHGDLQQSRREKIMEGFRSGRVNLLIATDVASRGIDVNDITHIFNYDVPYKIEDYVHRVGRTGRIGKSGKAYTLVTKEEGPYLTEIEVLINRELYLLKFPDLTSKWWPTPPPRPADMPEVEVEEYIPSTPGRKGRSTGGGGGRGGGRDSGKRGDRGSSRSGSRPERGDRRRDSRPSAPPIQQTMPRASDGAPSGDAPAAPVIEPIAGLDGAPSVSAPPRERGERSGNVRPARGARVEIVCARCGAHAFVNFAPDPTRPVYCAPCHKVVKRERIAAEQLAAAGASHLHELDAHVDFAGPMPSDAMITEDATGIPAPQETGGGLGGAEINLFD